MRKLHKTSAIAVTFLTLIAVSSLTACQSKPQLKQVASDAPDRPINTPESADQLKKKYEK